MSVVAFAPRPHPTANQPKKDLYEVGQIPPLGHVPKSMYAWVIRRDRHGPPEQSMQLEVVPTHTIGEDEVLVLVMAAGVNYNGVWAGLGLPISPFDVHKQELHIAGSDAAGIRCRARREGEGYVLNGSFKQSGSPNSIVQSTLNDPTPHASEDFGTSSAGIGNVSGFVEKLEMVQICFAH